MPITSEVKIPYLRTSERASFKRCQQRWFWSFREGLVEKHPKPGALWFGTGQHLAMAEYYIPGLERGRHPTETWREYCEEEQKINVKTDDDEWLDAEELGAIMLDGYVKERNGDPNWDVIAPEQTFSIMIEDPRNPGEGLVLYVGTFDMVIRNRKTGKVWLVDHKTAKTIDTKHLPLDDQASSYLTVATQTLRAKGILGPKQEIAGIIYNFLAKRKPDPRPRNAQGSYLNKDGSVSKVQPPRVFYREPVFKTARQRNRQIERIQTEAIQMEPFRTGELTLTKNPTKDCSWDCPFYDMCIVDESGGDVQGFKDSVYNIEDPYMDHRAGAQNTKESLAATRALKGKG